MGLSIIFLQFSLSSPALNRISMKTMVPYLVKQGILDNTFSIPVSEAGYGFIYSTRIQNRWVNVNGPYQEDALNIYLIKDPGRVPALRSVSCNCVAIFSQTSILCDSSFLHALLYSFDPRAGPSEPTTPEAQKALKDAGLNLDEMMAGFADSVTTSILQWVIGHEIGHIQHGDQSMAYGQGSHTSISISDRITGATRRIATALGILHTIRSDEYDQSPLRDVELAADTFVIHNISPDQLLLLGLNLHNFSGLLASLIDKARPSRLRPDGTRVARFHPNFHPDLDFRALKMAALIDDSPLLQQPESEKQIYKDQLASYVLEETPLDDGRFCQIPEELEAGESRRMDITQQERRSLQALATLAFDLIPGEANRESVAAILSVFGGRDSFARDAFPAPVHWIASWILAMSLDVDDVSLNDSSAPILTILPQLHDHNPRIPLDLYPAYLRAVKIYLKARGSLPSAARVPEAFASLEPYRPDKLREYLAEVIPEAFDDRVEHKEFLQAAVAYEAADLVDQAKGDDGPGAAALHGLLWPLVKWALDQQDTLMRRSYTVPYVVRTTDLNDRIPKAFTRSMLKHLGNIMHTWTTDQLVDALQQSHIVDPTVILSQMLRVASSLGINEVLAPMLAVGSNICAEAGCTSVDWISGQFRATMALDGPVEVIKLLQKEPGRFWAAAASNRDSGLFDVVRNGMQSNELAEQWLTILSTAPVRPDDDIQLLARIKCDLTGTLVQLGRSDQVLGAASECMAASFLLSKNKCDANNPNGDPQWHQCFDMYATMAEVHYFRKDLHSAQEDLSAARRYYDENNKEKLDIHEINFIISGRRRSWADFEVELKSPTK
jgi:hypothetical protein